MAPRPGDGLEFPRQQVRVDLPGQLAGNRGPAGGKHGPVPGNDGERTVRGGHGQQLGFHDVAFFGDWGIVRADWPGPGCGLGCRRGAPEVHGGVGAPGAELTEIRAQGRSGAGAASAAAPARVSGCRCARRRRWPGRHPGRRSRASPHSPPSTARRRRAAAVWPPARAGRRRSRNRAHRRPSPRRQPGPSRCGAAGRGGVRSRSPRSALPWGTAGAARPPEPGSRSRTRTAG